MYISTCVIMCTYINSQGASNAKNGNRDLVIYGDESPYKKEYILLVQKLATILCFETAIGS